MRKSQAAIFNYRKEADDLETLLDKYKEIEGSVSRTKDDLAQQAEYVQQMQDLLGDEVNAIDLTGKFNVAIVEEEIQKRREEANEEFKNSIEETKKRYLDLAVAYRQTTDTIVRQQILLQNAIEKGVINSYSDFLDKTTAERERILAESQLEMNALAYLTKYDEEGNKIGGFVDEEKLADAKQLLAELFDQDFANSPLTKQLDQLNDMHFEKWDWQITDALGALSPELRNIMSLMEQFGTESVQELNNITSNSDLTTQQIIKLNTVLSDMNLAPEQQKELLRNLTAEGGNTFETLRNFANNII